MKDLPPGPRSSIPSLIQYMRDPIGVMMPLVQKYGDPFTLPGKNPIVITGDPEGIKAIYTADPDSFEPLNKDFGFFLGDRALILLSGSEHKRARKLMMPPFHGQRMRAYGEQIIRLAREHSANWRPGQTIPMMDVLLETSLDVILQAVFGVSDPARMKELTQLLHDIIDNTSPLLGMFPGLRKEFGGFGPYARFVERKQRLNTFLQKLIAERRAAGPQQDVLSLLIDAKTEDGEHMSDSDIRDQLVLLVVAGHETTAMSMGWCLYALHRAENADVREKLLAELATIERDTEPEKIAKWPYLDATCDESLRRFPLAPAPNPRKLLRPLTVKGYTLPAGVSVSAAIDAAHFREQTYPEPMRFRPERFLERQYSPFEFLPYGGGSRRCLGAAMASYEMRLVLATLLSRFRLSLASQRPDTGKVRMANSGPAHGVKMIVDEVNS
ncbi:MAG TPA: cytochrome P450 [Polyangium sp.]|nr:cytochrome P450 [Polyangium sp.]